MPGAYQAPRAVPAGLVDALPAPYGGSQIEDLRGGLGGLSGLLGQLRGIGGGGVGNGGVDPNRGYIQNPAYPGGSSAGPYGMPPLGGIYDDGGLMTTGPVGGGGLGYGSRPQPSLGGDVWTGPFPGSTFDAGGRSPELLQKQWAALDPASQNQYRDQFMAASPTMQKSVLGAMGLGGAPSSGAPAYLTNQRYETGVTDQLGNLRQQGGPGGGMGPAATAAMARLGNVGTGLDEARRRQSQVANQAGALAGGASPMGGGYETGLTQRPAPAGYTRGPAAGTAVAGGTPGGVGGSAGGAGPSLGGGMGGLSGLASDAWQGLKQSQGGAGSAGWRGFKQGQGAAGMQALRGQYGMPTGRPTGGYETVRPTGL
jgi:hypothetical protein